MRQFLRVWAGTPPRSAFSRFFGVDPLSRQAARLYRGAAAELNVVEAIAGVCSEWTVLHSLPVSGERPLIEHLLVGPAGVFVLSLHNHADAAVWVGERTVIVGGSSFPHIDRAEAEGEYVAAGLVAAGCEVKVTPCILFVDPAQLHIARRPKGIEALDSRALWRWLASLPRLHSAEAVQRIGSAAAETWGSAALNEQLPDLEAFGEAGRTIARARRRRVGWALIGAALALGAAAATMPILLEDLGLL